MLQTSSYFPKQTQDNEVAGWVWAQYAQTEQPDMQQAVYIYTASSR